MRTAVEEDILSEDLAWSAPRVLLRLIEWLASNAADIDGLFEKEVSSENYLGVIEAIDAAGDLPQPGMTSQDEGHAVAAALLHLLRHLRDSPVPFGMHERCAQAQRREEAFEIISEFPMPSANLLISLTAFLHFYVSCGRGNPRPIAARFAPALFHDDPHATTRLTPLKMRAFVMKLIVDELS